MFKIFKKLLDKKTKTKTSSQIIQTANSIISSVNKTSTKHKEDLEDFILILKQIQEINNQKTLGKGSVLKNYTNKKNGIENATQLAIEKYTKKIEELDNANI